MMVMAEVLEHESGEMEAREFVWKHGQGARASDLGFVLKVSPERVAQWRTEGPSVAQGAAHSFAELFRLKHGRAPAEDEWPAPAKAGQGGYEWQEPEVAMLATLVGMITKEEIAGVLTERLKLVTGDESAERTLTAVQVKINVIGMQTGDVVGGLTITAAAKEVNSRSLVQHAVDTGAVAARRLGKLWVLNRDSWEAWKASRVLPPAGFVQLSTLREPLGIKSDKLSEFARMGLVPTAVRCTPFGGSAGSTKFGTWYVAPDLAAKLLEDRRQGKKMPWQGKALQDNLKATHRLWTTRQHPLECQACRDIWGPAGVPASFEDYAARYPALDHGAKRHLTMVWQPGMTVAEIAVRAGVSVGSVSRAIKGKLLEASDASGSLRAGKSDVARWIAAGCPSGDSMKSWMTVEHACNTYDFSPGEIAELMGSGDLPSKVCDAGPSRGQVLVLKRRCAVIRQTAGYTVERAAKKLGVSVAVMGSLLDGLQWRQREQIPLEVVQSAKKRLASSKGMELVDAAIHLGVPLKWIEQQIAHGVVKVVEDRTEPGRRVLTAVNVERLRQAAGSSQEQAQRLGPEWLRLSQAAEDAGVSTATLCAWGNAGEVNRRMVKNGWRYDKASVRERARRYWATVKLGRKKAPAWICEAAAPVAGSVCV